MNEFREEIEELKKKIQVYVNLGRFDTAEKLLKTSLSEYGPLANLHNLLGTIYHKQGKFPESITHFKKAVELNPEFTEACINLSSLYCDLSRYEDAEQTYQLLLNSTNNSKKIPNFTFGKIANAHAETGKLYEDVGLFKEAITEYNTALTLFSPMPDIQLRLGQLYLQLENLIEAKKTFELLLNLDPNNTEARIKLGITFYKLGQIDFAKQHWEISTKNAPNNHFAKSYKQISNHMTN